MRRLFITVTLGCAACLLTGDFTPSAKGESLRRAYRRAARTYNDYQRWHNTYYGRPSFYGGYSYYVPGNVVYYTPGYYGRGYYVPGYYGTYTPGYGYGYDGWGGIYFNY